MRSTPKLLAYLIMVALLGMGCNLTSLLSSAPTPTLTPFPTEVSDDAQVLFATRTSVQDATAIFIPPTVTPTPPNTPTPLPTETGTITSTPIPCNWAQFVNDVSYPDDSLVLIKKTFVKTWRLKNIGRCSWNSGYKVVWAEETSFDVPITGQSFPDGVIAPGGFMDVSISLKAPSQDGMYQGFFRLASPDGMTFGIGPNADSPFWVKVQVAEPTPTPTKTTVPAPDLKVSKFSIDPSEPVHDVLVTVSITIHNSGNTKAGSFTVKWWGDDTSDVSCHWNVGSLDPYSDKTLSCATYQYSKAGDFITKVFVDSSDQVKESDETNNIYKEKVTVK
jgi:hypothetical protein